MVWLSIIVPFYNVEQYIEQCVRSLYNQDIPLEEYEVICVDDCSPDGSRKIVERLQKEYPTLRLICHTENKRQGGARNTGLREAHGKYIWFVDSDDYIKPNVFGGLLKEAETNCLDILQFKFQIEPCFERNFEAEHVEWGPMEGIQYVLSAPYKWSIFVPIVWRSIFLRQFLLEHNSFFVEYHQYEDTDWALKLFYQAKNVKMISAICYVYRINQKSTTNSVDTPNKLIDQVLLLLRSSALSIEITDMYYKKLILNYVQSELFCIGKHTCQLPIFEKLDYSFKMRRLNVSDLKKFTTMRNWLRIKYGLSISKKTNNS